MRQMTVAGSIVFALSGSAFAAGQTTAAARVENLRSTPPEGGVITVRYDLIAADSRAVFTIGLEASDDGGRTWNVKPQSLTGDVGPNVVPGPGKRIAWEAGKDLEILRAFQFRVTPTLLSAPAPPSEPPVVEQRARSTEAGNQRPSQLPLSKTRYDLVGGYAYLSRFSSLRGWFVGGDVTLRKWFGIAVQVSGNSSTSQFSPGSFTVNGIPVRAGRSTFAFYGAGPRFQVQRQALPRLTLFGALMFGSSYTSTSYESSNSTRLLYLSDKRFAIQSSGGGDINFSGCCGIRAQLAGIFSDDFIRKDFQFSVGFVFRPRVH